jgi:hypothetical protein
MPKFADAPGADKGRNGRRIRHQGAHPSALVVVLVGSGVALLSYREAGTGATAEGPRRPPQWSVSPAGLPIQWAPLTPHVAEPFRRLCGHCAGHRAVA